MNDRRILRMKVEVVVLVAEMSTDVRASLPTPDKEDDGRALPILQIPFLQYAAHTRVRDHRASSLCAGAWRTRATANTCGRRLGDKTYGW